jgi:hypothetical protein
MKKLVLRIFVVAIIVVAVTHVSIVVKSENNADFSFASMFSLANGENEDGDEKDQTGIMTCPDGSEIECVICLKGETDCSPTCSTDLCED